jgi:hypothetical protein
VWELQAIHQALVRQEIEISDHAYLEAGSENIPYVAMLEAILVGLPVNKDLLGNPLGQKAGTNFEHRLDDSRWIRVKVSWADRHYVVTTHTFQDDHDFDCKRNQPGLHLHPQRHQPVGASRAQTGSP